MSRFKNVIMVGVCLAAALPAAAQEYKGAIESLRAVEEIRRGSAPKKPLTPAGILRQEMLQFRSRSANIAPDEAAKTWLGFVDRFFGLCTSQPSDGSALSFDELIAVLPPPSAWKPLAARIHARPPGKYPVADTCLCMLGDALISDTTNQASNIAKLEKQVIKLTNTSGTCASDLMHLKHQLVLRSQDRAMIAKSFDFMLSVGRIDGQFGFETDVPDLVKLVGKTDGERLIRKFLLIPQYHMGFFQSEEGKPVIRKIALEMVDKLKAPLWSLIDAADPTSIPLYEAMDRRFHARQPAAKGGPIANALIEEQLRSQGDNDNSQSARVEYLFCLAAWGKTEDALKFARSGGIEPSSSNMSGMASNLVRMGRAQPIYDFLRAALTKNPALNLWDSFEECARATGHRSEVIPFFKAALGNAGLNAQVRTEIRTALHKALLADDRIDEAVVLLRTMMKEPDHDSNFGFGESLSSGTELASLGRILNRPKWVEEGMAMACKRLLPHLKEQPFVGVSIAAQLFEGGKGPEAERALIETLAATPERIFDRGMGYGSPENQTLAALADLYHVAGRHQDVLALFERASDWNIGDLADGGAYLSEQNGGLNGGKPLAFIAASALAATGSKKEAIPLVEATLYGHPDFDPAYQLMVDIRGAEALPYLDHLHKLNRTQERPLIWKARVLFDDGRLEDAERAAREAIRIDPCDEESPKGRRMLAQSVLADILDARGNKAEASRLRELVRATRICEDGDELANAGLLTRAINRYREALKIQPDFICLHMRLATRLSELGRFQEADEHYRHAFELMPESKHRCNAASGQFNDKRSYQIAERVFAELAAKLPNSARLEILLGDLKSSEERPDLALPHYKRAAALDRKSVDAWNGLSTTLSSVQAPQSEIDSAGMKLVKAGGEGVWGLHSCLEPALLWNAAEIAGERNPPDPPDRLFPLPASAMRLRAEGDRRLVRSDSILSINRASSFGFNSFSLNRVRSPGEELTHHTIISAIERLLSASLPQH